MIIKLFALLFPVAVLGQTRGGGGDSIPESGHQHLAGHQRPDGYLSPAGHHSPTGQDSPAGHQRPAAITVQYGIASFYSNKFEGRKTYTDEIFTQEKLTGASNTLPMHVWVKVTNLRNHLWVIVRINDKMHPRNKRIIDLSRAAAIRLGYAGRGLTRVRIDVLGRKRPAEAG